MSLFSRRRLVRLPAAGLLALLGVLGATAAHAQVYATGISASLPDPNGKVPAFNAIAGAGIATWSIGFAQAVLTHGHSCNYCVSLGRGTASGKASVAFKLAGAGAVIQTAAIVAAKNFTVGSNGTWYYCSGYLVAPDSPGPATLLGIVNYTASGATKAVQSKVSNTVLLN